MKSLSALWELVKIFAIALVIVLPIRYFIFQPFVVRGESMVPNYHEGDYLIIDEISYRFSEPERGDVIVFKYPKDPSQKFIKRIVGLPGETVKINNDQVFVNDELLPEPYLTAQTYGNLAVALNSDEYFVLGDNRPYSADSRLWGILPKANITGKVSLRLFPFNRLSLAPN